MIDRAKIRHEKGKKISDVCIIVNKVKGWPMSLTSIDEHEYYLPRDTLFDKYLCIFCQEITKERLHNVETANMGQQLLEIGKGSKNEVVRRRLNLLVADGNPLSAVASDMKYHLSCLMSNKRICYKQSETLTRSEKNSSRLMADLEIIEILKCELDDIKDKVINMNEIQDVYVYILHEHGYNVPEKPAFKKYLKKLILDNLRDV